MIKLIARLLRRRPVLVSTYKVKKSDWYQRRSEKCRQLARELGLDWEAK
ncbi:hypothetical protein AB4Y96_09030 [Phyllobacterium sp. TAF24]